jgi:hypothetical protein
MFQIFIMYWCILHSRFSGFHLISCIGDLSRIWLSYLGPFGLLMLTKTLNYLAFQSFDYECTWWRLFQKSIVHTKLAHSNDWCLNFLILFLASCHNYFCAFYGECYIDKVTNEAACRCPVIPCPDVHAPVCGDDGMTYQTTCHLKYSSCKKERRIKVKHVGRCKGEGRFESIQG